MKRVLTPALAAVAVVALIGVLFWVAASGDDSTEASFGSGDTAVGSDGSAGGGMPGDEGSEEPGNPGTAPGGDPDVPDDEAPAPEPTPSGQFAVPVDTYFQYDGRRLALSYYIGVPECYGTIDEPVVEESEDAVVVTLTRVPPETDEDVACIEIALQKSVDITLSEPLGDRPVLDGSFDPPAKVPETERRPKPAG